MHFSIIGFGLGVHLHGGYDWPATRNHIDAEIKAMRRNLIKLRQLLASGQSPQEPVGAQQSYLFNSLLIGLPETADLNEPEEAMSVIDEELDMLGGETASQNSSRITGLNELAGRVSPSQRKSSSKYLRSAKHQIELVFRNVNLSSIIMKPNQSEIRRFSLDCDDIQIIDHIRTSNWKSFLTEWRSDKKGSVREAGARFFKMELIDILPEGGHSTESRLKVCTT